MVLLKILPKFWNDMKKGIRKAWLFQDFRAGNNILACMMISTTYITTGNVTNQIFVIQEHKGGLKVDRKKAHPC